MIHFFLEFEIYWCKFCLLSHSCGIMVTDAVENFPGGKVFAEYHEESMVGSCSGTI